MGFMFDSLEGYIRPGSEEDRLARRLDFSGLPKHVAVIMDGNGRWAAKRGKSRIEGHKAGSDSVKDIVEASARLGIKVLTLYAFSRENWKRPKREVSELWALLKSYLKNEGKVLMENDLKLKVIGQKSGIPSLVLREIERVEKQTASNGRMTVVLALNYSGREEILGAVRKFAARGCADPASLDEASFSGFLDTASLPDPDLLIRTSGEMRLSNFLLWQVAYTEFWITPVFWPDFRAKHLLHALIDYQQRERRFGDVRPRRRHNP
jgi:undecaprenyl diphosphate synthase